MLNELQLLDDATPTYRAFRRQAVYCLWRLFKTGLPDSMSIQPEGIEDLAILKADGIPVEVVQVKDYSTDLVISKFKADFFRRNEQYCKQDSETIVKIASFGPLGKDLAEANEQDTRALARVQKSIEKRGVSKTIAASFVKHCQIEKIDEQQVTEELLEILKSSFTAFAPSASLDFFTWWMMQNSEQKKVIDRQLAISKINEIGKLVADRGNFHDEWGTCIVPVTRSASALNESKLALEFYNGVKAKFDHIELGLDVKRTRLLTALNDKLNKSQVVVVHSSSGQGKSALAYRYIKEFTSSEFRFEVVAINDRKHARRIASAINGHRNSVIVPTLVYLDVEPGQLNWIELLRGLACVEGIRVLVTIREEDWRRTNLSKADFDFDSLELDFDRTQAEEMFKLLPKGSRTKNHVDFEEAWSKFGSKKQLLEFVHFVTQFESLRDRIGSQVRVLEANVNEKKRPQEELSFLRSAAVANAYEARLDARLATKFFNLQTPKLTVENLEKEYFVRQSLDKRFVEPLHAIRSELLCEAFFDEGVFPWGETADATLPLIHEEDLEMFLLCAFSRRHGNLSDLMISLKKLHPKTWLGIRGVTRALLWLGVSEYVKENSDVFAKAKNKVGSSFYAMTNMDVGLANPEEPTNFFAGMGESFSDVAEFATEIQEQQTDRKNVFTFLNKWLNSFQVKPEFPESPEDSANLLAMAEVLFWIGRGKLESVFLDKIDKSNIKGMIEKIAIESVGDFATGMCAAFPEWYREWVKREREWLENHIRSKGRFVHFINEADRKAAYFVFDLELENVALNNNSNSIHELTRERVELLAAIFPGKKRYGATGLGLKSSIVGDDYDEGDLSGVMASAMPPKWSSRLNSVFRGLVTRDMRPNDWGEFHQSLQSALHKIETCIEDFAATISHASISSTSAEVPASCASCLSMLSESALLPITAVDEWGFVVEGNRENSPQFGNRFNSTVRFKSLIDLFRDMKGSLRNFINQAKDGLILVPHIKPSDSAAKARVLKVAKELDLSEEGIRLSVVNLFKFLDDVRLFEADLTTFEKLYVHGKSDQNYIQRTDAAGDLVEKWLRFISPLHRIVKLSDKKKKRSSKKKDSTTEAILRSIRNKFSAEFKKLKCPKINCSILSRSPQWKDRSALWIQCDVDHPMDTMLLPFAVWRAIYRGFEPHHRDISFRCALDHFWKNIIVVPTICGKSMGNEVMPYFHHATYQSNTVVPRLWQGTTEPVSQSTLEHLGIECWPATTRKLVCDKFFNAYVKLFVHVDHMADFFRLPPEIDDEGAEFLQAYLRVEEKRSSLALQSVFDTATGFLEQVNLVCDENDEPSEGLLGCMEALIELRDAMWPKSDFEDGDRVTIEESVAWRDRMLHGFSNLGFAKLLWQSEIYGFPAYDLEKIELQGKELGLGGMELLELR